MQSGLYVSLSSQMALERRLTTLADNMANINTVGFRSTDVKFDEVLSATHNAQNAKVAFVSQGNDYLSTRQGQFDRTGNPLDFAIKGEGWFSIDTPSGQVMTRDGRFSLTETGALVSSRGYPVLDPGGAPIQINREGGEISVGAGGNIIQDGRQVGTIGIFSFDLDKGFIRHENSGVIPTDTPAAIVDDPKSGIVQGYVEQSNVNGVREMTQLIQINRAFDSISSVMRESESSMQEAIRTLGGSR